MIACKFRETDGSIFFFFCFFVFMFFMIFSLNIGKGITLRRLVGVLLVP